MQPLRRLVQGCMHRCYNLAAMHEGVCAYSTCASVGEMLLPFGGSNCSSASIAFISPCNNASCAAAAESPIGKGYSRAMATASDLCSKTCECNTLVQQYSWQQSGVLQQRLAAHNTPCSGNTWLQCSCSDSAGCYVCTAFHLPNWQDCQREWQSATQQRTTCGGTADVWEGHFCK